MARKQLTLEGIFLDNILLIIRRLHKYNPQSTFSHKVTPDEILEYKDNACDCLLEKIEDTKHMIFNEQYDKFDVLEQLIDLQLITYNDLPANLKQIYNDNR